MTLKLSWLKNRSLSPLWIRTQVCLCWVLLTPCLSWSCCRNESWGCGLIWGCGGVGEGDGHPWGLAGFAPHIMGLPWGEPKREGEMAPRMEVTVWKVTPSSTITFSIFCLLEVNDHVQPTFEGRLWHRDDMRATLEVSSQKGYVSIGPRQPPLCLCIFVLVWLLLFLSFLPFPLVFVEFNPKAISWSPASLTRIWRHPGYLWSQKYFSLRCIFYKEGKRKLLVEKSGREQLSLVNKKHHQ